MEHDAPASGSRKLTLYATAGLLLKVRWLGA
jgi:hypothetical protein